MPTTNTRFTLSVPTDIAERADTLKKNIFYDKPYAEMYRQLILLGMEKLEEKEAAETGDKRTS